jgi:hypothetical protein
MANNGSDDDGAANNGFGWRSVHQWEGRLLYDSGDYTAFYHRLGM